MHDNWWRASGRPGEDLVYLKRMYIHLSPLGQTHLFPIHEKKLPFCFPFRKKSHSISFLFLFFPFVTIPSIFPSKFPFNFFHHFRFPIQEFSAFPFFHLKFLPSFFTFLNFPSKIPSKDFFHLSQISILEECHGVSWITTNLRNLQKTIEFVLV